MSEKHLPALVGGIRVAIGLVYLINGLNWWVKLIGPYPSISDFIHSPPPPDLVGAMIKTGIFFHLVKGLELLTGLALMANRFVPLMLVIVMTVTVPIFIVDVFFVASLRGYVMGGGALLLNCYLLLSYIGHYQAMLLPKAQPDCARDGDTGGSAGSLAPAITAILRPAMPMLGYACAALALVMLGWLGVMIVQHAFPGQPRGF